MAYYRVCSFCGAHLDPGEKCDCRRARGETDGNRNSRKVQKGVKHGKNGEKGKACIQIESGAKTGTTHCFGQEKRPEDEKGQREFQAACIPGDGFGIENSSRK